MTGQISINDYLSKDIPLGWVDDSKIGAIIPFQNLKDYIGKRVIYRSAIGSNTDEGFFNKLVLIKEYLDKSDTYYTIEEDGNVSFYNDYIRSISSKDKQEKMKKAFVCDRIAYSDDNRTKKANSWLSEAFCINGRYRITHNSSSVCFCEYKAI